MLLIKFLRAFQLVS